LLDGFGRVLEPSAGLGRLYRAVRSRSADCPITLVDASPECCGELYRATEGDGAARLVAGDFLAMDAARLGEFDAVVMNPPFTMGTDVKHVRHALTFLAPRGRLVAVCANGPKQRAALRPIAAQWIDLPAGSFKSEGTNVNAAIVVIDK
jgi:16S rRNA G1207 methylase RsmC